MAAEFDIELPETVLNMFHYQFTWRFENVYMCGKLLNSCVSGPRYSGKLLSFPWTLSIGQSTKSGVKGISLFIQRTDKKNNMAVNFRTVVYKNFDEDAFFDQKFRKTFNEGDVWESPVIVTNDEFKMEAMSGNINQRWKIQVHLRWNDYLDYRMVADKYAPIVNNFMLIRRIGKHLKEFYKDEWLSDVRLKIGNETVPAHKMILGARCAYLAEKLESYTGNMIELDEDFIPCKDPEIVNTFLLYLYSGDVYSIAENGPLPIGIENLAQEVRMHDLLRLTMPTFFTGTTSVKLHSANHEWKIVEFQIQEIVHECVTLVGEAFGEEEMFRLYVYLRGNDREKLTISLKLEIEQEVSIYAIFDILVTCSSKSVLNRRAVGELSPEDFLEIPDVLSLDQLLVEKELNLACRVRFSDGQLNTRVQTIPVECNIESHGPVPEFSFIKACEGWNMLRMNIGGLFDNDDYSDCSIEIGEDTIPAHRLILAARCPYFSSVINMQEENIAGSSLGMKIYVEQDINICVYVMEEILRVFYDGFIETTREKLRMNIDLIAKFFGLEAIDDTKTRRFPFAPPLVIRRLRIGNTLQSSNEYSASNDLKQRKRQ